MQRVSADCFAGCMGTAVCTDGFDALLTKVDDRYVLDVRTEKGRALAEGLFDGQTDAEFDETLGHSVDAIYAASIT